MIGRARFIAAASLAVAAASAWAVPGARPAPGRHASELCVATTAGAPSCGPAQADLQSNGSLSVRVDDVVYHLTLHSSQVDVLLMHNAVQIDEFTAPYEWVGSVLRFNDEDRNVRYEVRFTPAPGETRP